MKGRSKIYCPVCGGWTNSPFDPLPINCLTHMKCQFCKAEFKIKVVYELDSRKYMAKELGM